MKLSNEFSQTILESVDEGLSILGDESVLSAFYYQFRKQKNMVREEIPYKLGIFLDFIEELFGEGALFIERRIEKTFCGRVGMPYDEELKLKLTEYIRRANHSHISNAGK